MHIYEIAHLIHERERSNKKYLEFLKIPSLSVGLYVLKAGEADPQQPHTEDEIYYVVSGRASIKVGHEDRPVKAGSIVYVAANVEHRFHSIAEDVTLLVFFAPAEYSLAKRD
jgi:mannose-6-phosphate isomerase-like protein (cupin superfamily)